LEEARHLKRRIFFGIFISSLLGCQDQSTKVPSLIPPQQNSYQKPIVPKQEKETDEPEVKPSVWLPPLEKYEKPVKKEKWFQPRIHDGGGTAVDCNDCYKGSFPCDVCNGTGYLRAATGLRDSRGNWIQRGTPCIKCGGSGGFSCKTCAGTGYLKELG
jgi:hypothetical protein